MLKLVNIEIEYGCRAIFVRHFYVCMDVRSTVTDYEPRRGRSRVPSGTYWGPIDKYLLHCIRTFRVGFELYQILYQYSLNEFDMSRIRLEPWFEYIRSRGSPFTGFTVHGVHRSLGSPSIWNVYELRQEPMKHPLD